MRSSALAASIYALVLATTRASAQYQLLENFSGAQFFSGWDFINGFDNTTNGAFVLVLHCLGH